MYSWYSRVQYFKKSIRVSKFIFTLIQFKSILENDYIKVQSTFRYDIQEQKESEDLIVTTFRLSVFYSIPLRKIKMFLWFFFIWWIGIYLLFQSNNKIDKPKNANKISFLFLKNRWLSHFTVKLINKSLAYFLVNDFSNKLSLCWIREIESFQYF